MNDGPNLYAVDDAASPSRIMEGRIAELEKRLQETEQALLRSNGKLRQSLEVGKLGAWERDLETNDMVADPTCRAHFGLRVDEHFTFERLQDLTHPDDLERMGQAISYALRTKSDFNVEYRVIRPDGHVARLLVRGGAVYEGDRPVRLIGISQDVTERERIREERKKIQRRQEFLLQLNDQLRDSKTPHEIMEVTTRSLAHLLNVDSVGYGELTPQRDAVIVPREWSRGAISNEGRIFPFDGIPSHQHDLMRQGKPIIIEDVQTDPNYSDPLSQEFYRTANVRSALAVCILRDGQIATVLYLASAEPRTWSSEDISLAEDVAKRAWTAIEKLRAEISLRESEARFRTIAEALPGIVWIVTPDLELTYTNDRWVEFSGLSKEEAHGHSWMSTIHPDDVAKLVADAEVIRASGAAYEAEVRYRALDGSYRWHLMKAAPLYDAFGVFKGWVGTSVDIHKLVETEAALRETEERFKLITKALPGIAFIHRPDMELVYANEKWAEFSGMSMEETMGYGWLAALHPDDIKMIREDLKVPKKDELVTGKLRYRAADGSYRWHLAQVATYFDEHGEYKWKIGTSVDIHDLVETTEALRKSEERLSLAQRAARIGVCDIDATTGAVTWSAEHEELFGLEPGTFEGTHEGWTSRVHPADVAVIERRYMEAVATGQREMSFSYRVPLPDGTMRHVEGSYIIFYGDDGHPTRIVGINIDMTKHKQAEERQQLLIRELHHRVKNTLATVQAIVGSTARAASSIDEFYQGFVGRIVSLARTHNLLTEDLWQKASLKEMLQIELGPYEDEAKDRVVIEGPSVELPSEAAVPVGMAIHELTTNAAKHGALSSFGGRVEVKWSIEEGKRPMLHFSWIEHGGPRVAAPERQGFGSRLLQRVLTTQLQAQVNMDFREDGLCFTMAMPIPSSSPFLLHESGAAT